MSVKKQIKDLIYELTPHETFTISTSSKNTNRLNIADQDPLYKSSQTKINKSYLVYTSPRKIKNNENLFLLFPKNTISTSNENSYKLKNEIQNINKNLGIYHNTSKDPKDLLLNSFSNKNEKKKITFRNKPIIRLNSQGLNYIPETSIVNTYSNRSLVEPGIFKATLKLKDKEYNDNGKKGKFIMRKLDQFGKYSKTVSNSNQFLKNKNKDNNEYNRFMREMNGFKERKINQWRQQFLEDNLKY